MTKVTSVRLPFHQIISCLETIFCSWKITPYCAIIQQKESCSDGEIVPSVVGAERTKASALSGFLFLRENYWAYSNKPILSNHFLFCLLLFGLLLPDTLLKFFLWLLQPMTKPIPPSLGIVVIYRHRCQICFWKYSLHMLPLPSKYTNELLEFSLNVLC